MTYEDGNFEVVAREAEALVLEGNLVFMKWSCRFCGERVTMSQPNIFTTKGMHEGCPIDPDGITDIKAQGCNYLLVQTNSVKGRNVIEEMLAGEDTE